MCVHTLHILHARTHQFFLRKSLRTYVGFSCRIVGSIFESSNEYEVLGWVHERESEITVGEGVRVHYNKNEDNCI